jgi:hypothetical protein
MGRVVRVHSEAHCAVTAVHVYCISIVRKKVVCSFKFLFWQQYVMLI